ncbi:MAG TPA: HPr(Ser) kinase/phosphatase [Ignavibacteria bacterium]|nr:HPr(Ser) kinase/phosphatase [Ignavibacteria bacterium]
MSDRFSNLKEIKKESISVDFFYESCKERFRLHKVSQNKISPDKLITDKDIHRPGLALAGYIDLFTYKRIQVFGNTEIRYLNSISDEDRKNTLEKFFTHDIPCIIVTNENEIPKELMMLADKTNTPVLRTNISTTRAAYLISDFLDDQFSVQIIIHGSFVDVYGIGLMFTGKSGIGKSEITLDLIERGHRLVADDVVVVSKKAESVLMGSGTNLVKHFMEVRGLGIIDIKSIFGIRAIRFQKRVEVIVELLNWDPSREYDRTGLDTKKVNLLGVDVELIRLPIFPGKNITVIAEVIALNYLCKHYGYNPAEEFNKKLTEEINKKSETNGPDKATYDRTIEYFEHDFE